MPSGGRARPGVPLHSPSGNQCWGAPPRHVHTDTQGRQGRRVLDAPHPTHTPPHSYVQGGTEAPLSPRAPGSGMSRPGPCPSERPSPSPLFPCASPKCPHPSLARPFWLPSTVCSSPSLPARSQLSSGSQGLHGGSGLPVGPRFPGDLEGLAPGGGAGTERLQFPYLPPGCALAPLLGEEQPP